ncbi:hypothetical protein LPJ66_001234 [Kickxella alabastrina]|uniref:Uncharacterized protein n=1 Tax=Kickxella alabastrina TaxID=61397 RepID=A0ACC1IU01_9FUNG|nr:hypothetical protein LPJ66_001234 [Kickxella alabastrina]
MPAPTPVTVPTFDPMSISTPPAPSTIPEPDFAPATASGNVLSLANAPASTSASGASLGSTDLPLTFMLNGLFKNTGLGKLDTVGEHSGESLPFGLHFSPTHDSTVNDMWSKSHSGSHWETSSGTSWSKGLHTAHHSKSGQDNNKMADDYDMYDLSGLDNSAGKSATMSLVAIVLSLISLVAA